jgi:autotransporter-associated beta strand protein
MQKRIGLYFTTPNSARRLSAQACSVLAGSAALIKHGTGLAVIQRQSVYTNGTVVNEGTLRLDVNDALLGVGAVNLNGGELVLGTTSQQIGLLTLNGGSLGGGTVVASNYVLRDGTVNSVLAGTGSLVKQGAGVARILSVNTYAGGTTLENGVLALELDNALFASGSVAISGGELRLGTTTQTLGSLTLRSGSISGGTIFGSRYEIHEGTVDAVLAGNDAAVFGAVHTGGLCGGDQNHAAVSQRSAGTEGGAARQARGRLTWRKKRTAKAVLCSTRWTSSSCGPCSAMARSSGTPPPT